MGLREFAAKHRYDATWQGVTINGDRLSHGFRRWAVADCTAEFQSGEALSKMSAGRVMGGAVLLGPLGAILGGMAKKDRSKVYVAIQTPTGPHIVEGPAKEQAQAMKLAANINAAASLAHEGRPEA